MVKNDYGRFRLEPLGRGTFYLWDDLAEDVACEFSTRSKVKAVRGAWLFIEGFLYSDQAHAVGRFMAELEAAEAEAVREAARLGPRQMH